MAALGHATGRKQGSECTYLQRAEWKVDKSFQGQLSDTLKSSLTPIFQPLPGACSRAAKPAIRGTKKQGPACEALFDVTC